MFNTFTPCPTQVETGFPAITSAIENIMKLIRAAIFGNFPAKAATLCTKIAFSSKASQEVNAALNRPEESHSHVELKAATPSKIEDGDVTLLEQHHTAQNQKSQICHNKDQNGLTCITDTERPKVVFTVMSIKQKVMKCDPLQPASESDIKA
ncbi:hypothetical protein PoB_004354800 [Plakobranchus ocellatus]|uniref:Uncharacterized protein n=1 Tax=Plakobranchus ocellatus TaxID=259542 RepID=A0AAV4BCZ0_9GAST|nr:hypothetical protein PoB_004354800 [Plakobranchus ocellatus]